MTMPPLQSKPDRDRLRQRAAKARRIDRKVAAIVRRVIRDHLERGRPADACMADLIRAAQEQQ